MSLLDQLTIPQVLVLIAFGLLTITMYRNARHQDIGTIDPKQEALLQESFRVAHEKLDAKMAQLNSLVTRAEAAAEQLEHHLPLLEERSERTREAPLVIEE